MRLRDFPADVFIMCLQLVVLLDKKNKNKKKTLRAGRLLCSVLRGTDVSIIGPFEGINKVSDAFHIFLNFGF